MRLSNEQVARFHDEGYLMVEGVLSREELQPVIAEVEEAIERGARKLHAEGELGRLYEEEGFETRLTRIHAETPKLYWSICSGQLAGRGIFGLISNPRLLDIVECLVGPEIIAASAYRLRPKIPGFAHGVVPWHQDSGYFEPYCDRDLVLTIWLPLVDATPERGCLQFLPGAHRGPVVRHYQNRGRGYLEILPQDLPAGQVVTVPVPAGGVLLFTNRTPHQSTENVTDVIRWSMDLRYQGAHLPNNYRAPGAPEPLPPAEGAPVACYPPEADFLIRSRQRPGEVLSRWEEFHALRTRHQAGGLTRRWEALDA